MVNMRPDEKIENPKETSLTASYRRGVYTGWIMGALSKLKQRQKDAQPTHRGRFLPSEPEQSTSLRNSRWQEIVLPIAWAMRQGLGDFEPDLVLRGVVFWAGLQNKCGSFPQYCQRDSDFAATAFSSYATAAALNESALDWKLMMDQSDHLQVEKCMTLAGHWLSKNNEMVYTNQQMASALALLEISVCVDNSKFAFTSKQKLTELCANNKLIFFMEKKGFDIGYSTLTVEMMARYFLRTEDIECKEMILETVAHYLKFLEERDLSLIFSRGSRGTRWAIPGGFEVFITHLNAGRRIFGEIFSSQDVRHLPDVRHIHTDLCRLCFACDHAVIDLALPIENNRNVEYSIIEGKTKPARFCWIRKFGLHRFRRAFQWIRSACR